MSSSLSRLGDLLLGQTRGRILALLYGQPDRKLYAREIGRETQSSIGNVQRELNRLSEVGLILRTELGSQVFYQANAENPLFPELRSLLGKTFGLFERLRSSLAPLADRITIAFVYGSIARGEEKSSSDVDLMLIGKITLDETLQALGPLESEIRRPVNPTIYTSREYRSKLRHGNHFLQSLQNASKIFLIGGADELGKMA